MPALQYQKVRELIVDSAEKAEAFAAALLEQDRSTKRVWPSKSAVRLLVVFVALN